MYFIACCGSFIMNACIRAGAAPTEGTQPGTVMGTAG
jgi:hypothetical protein